MSPRTEPQLSNSAPQKNARPAYIPPHEDVKELQDCIKFLLFPDVGTKWNHKTLNHCSGWFTFAKSVVQELGQGRERPTLEHFQTVAEALFDSIDLDLERRRATERKERAELAKLKAKYPDA